MSAAELIIPEITTYPTPTTDDTQYEFSVDAHYIYSDGTCDSRYPIVLQAPSIANLPEEITNLDPEQTPLAWVSFYQQAVVRVTHPERFEGDKPGPKKVWDSEIQTNETIKGKPFPAAETQLLTDATDAGLTFASMSEILESGTVTPFMTAWLKRFSVENNAYGYQPFLKAVLPLLEPELRATILKNKYRYDS